MIQTVFQLVIPGRKPAAWKNMALFHDQWNAEPCSDPVCYYHVTLEEAKVGEHGSHGKAVLDKAHTFVVASGLSSIHCDAGGDLQVICMNIMVSGKGKEKATMLTGFMSGLDMTSSTSSQLQTSESSQNGVKESGHPNPSSN
jgi:hypothetical protein